MYRKYKSEEEKKKKRKKILAILLPLLFIAIAAGITIPIVITWNQKQPTDPDPGPSPTPQPEPYSGPTFKFKGTTLLGFNDGVTKKIILKRFPNKSITIPECDEIADGAFDNQIPSEITQLYLPPNTTKIGNSAFANNPNILKISFYENKDLSDWKLKSLGSKAFYNTGLKSFDIPFDLTSIGKDCFNKCTNLSYFDLRALSSGSAITLGTNSLSNLSKNGKIIVRLNTKESWKQKLADAGLNNPQQQTFSDTWTIEEFTCIDVQDNVCYGFKRDIPTYFKFLIKDEAENLVIPSNVVKISNKYGGFSNNLDIKTMYIPSSVDTIEEGCFINCTNINVIDISSYNSIPQWKGKDVFEGCNSVGQFEVLQKIRKDWEIYLDEYSGLIIDKTHWKVGYLVPEIEHALGIVAETDAKISFTMPSDGRIIDLNYSTDDGETWIKYESETIELPAGKHIYFQGDNPEGFNTNKSVGHFNIKEGKVSIDGSVMGLLNSAKEELDTIPNKYCFSQLFYTCSGITHVSENLLPATQITDNCYSCMFLKCSNLENAPKLPAKQVGYRSYYCLFSDCKALVYPPELNALELSEQCYYQMFNGCINLIQPPALPATKLSNSCYYGMFYSCNKIETTPDLPAKELADECYSSMFGSCISLTHVNDLPATSLANKCYYQMFKGCKSLETAPKLIAEKMSDYCYYEMFKDCESLNNPPELLSNELACNCYVGMFENCSSLQKEIELPALTMQVRCYQGMFKNCIKLESVKIYATSLAKYCFLNMFYNCKSIKSIKVCFNQWLDTATDSWLQLVPENGTFTCPSDLPIPSRRSSDKIPTGWDIVNE